MDANYLFSGTIYLNNFHLPPINTHPKSLKFHFIQSDKHISDQLKINRPRAYFLINV
jgi:hypothetical protein